MDYFISKMLRQRRLEANLSQEQLADRAEVDVRTIRRIEANKGGSPHSLKKVCNVLKIGFKEPEANEILSEYQEIHLPNVKSGRELAHLLRHYNHLDYYTEPESQLEHEEECLIEDFIETILELMYIFDFVATQERKLFIDQFDKELIKLAKQGIFIYGSCNDTLTDDFKMVELVFTKL